MASTNVISSVLGRNTGSAAGTDIGVASLAVRDDVLSTLAVADGDYTHLRVNSEGALHVTGGGGGGGGGGEVTNAGVFAVQVDGTALTHLETLAQAVTAGLVQVAVPVVNRGTLGNLFDAQVITLGGTGTASAAVNVSASTRANILVHGSDETAFTSYDVFYSPDSTTWLFVGAMFPNATDGNGDTTIGRRAYLSVDVAGINWLQIRAYTSETVTASCFSS